MKPDIAPPTILSVASADAFWQIWLSATQLLIEVLLEAKSGPPSLELRRNVTASLDDLQYLLQGVSRLQDNNSPNTNDPIYIAPEPQKPTMIAMSMPPSDIPPEELKAIREASRPKYVTPSDAFLTLGGRPKSNE